MKRNIAILTAMVLVCTALSGCGQDQAAPTQIVQPSSGNSVDILTHIATTQHFTDEAVPDADVETILQAGINAPSAMNGQPWHFSVITDQEVLQQISGGMGSMGFGGAPQGDFNTEMTPPEGAEIPEDMQLPEGFTPGEGMPEGFDPGENMPEGFAPEEGMPEGMEFPGGQMPSPPSGDSGGTSKAGIGDAPLVIVISCKSGSELDAGLACQNMSATAQLLGYGSKILTSPTMTLNGAEQHEMLGVPEGYTVAAVLLVGHPDTSVDGYTGATTRNSVSDMVTYVKGN